jgi:hypothetical protein
VEKRIADMVFGQLVGVTVDHALGQVFQQFSKAGTLLERWTGDDPLDELPSCIKQQVIRQILVRSKH